MGGYSDDDANFHRNFERDKDLLRQMGIPIVAEPLGRPRPCRTGFTGYRVPRDLYELPDPGLDEDELLALSLAVSAVAFDGSGAGRGHHRPVEAGRRRRRSEPGRPACGGGAAPLADVPTDERVATCSPEYSSEG